MRFFSGSRSLGGGGKNGRMSPGELFKQKMSGKKVLEKTPEEKYKEMIDNKVHKMMEDALAGRKKSVNFLPGTKKNTEPPKELSKNTQDMIRMLALRKAKKEQKVEAKKLKALYFEERAKKRAVAAAKAAKEQQEYDKRVADETAAAEAAKSSSSSWFFGNNDDNKSW